MPKSFALLFILFVSITTIPTQAQHQIDSLLSSLAGAKEDTNKVQLLGQISMEYTHSDLVQAEKFSDRALKLAEDLKDSSGIAMVYDVKGVIQFEKGQLDSSLYFYLEALKHFKNIDDPRPVCALYDKVAQIYGLTNDYPQAKKYYGLGLTLAKEIGDNRLLGNAYNGLASYHINLGNYLVKESEDSLVFIDHQNQSTQYLLEAASYFEKADYGKGSALIYGNLAFTKFALKDYNSALQYALKALDYFEKNNFRNYMMLSYNQICDIYIHQHQYKKALAYANKSLALNDEINNIYDLHDTYGLLMVIYEKSGDYKNAFHYSVKQNELSKKIYDKEKGEQLATIQGKYNTEQQEKENLLLKKEAELNQATIKRQNIITVFVVAILLVLTLVSVLTYRNLIERKKFATQIEELNSAQSRWFTNIAHELRTPLTLILGPIKSILTKDKSLNKDTKQHIELADRNGEQLLKQVNEILEVSRMESGKLKLKYAVTDLRALIHQVAASFHSFAVQKNITLEVDADQELLVNVDCDKISNILVNLTSNALKFTHDGGSVRLVMEYSSDSPYIQINVTDTGDGIPEKDLPLVFDRFYQVTKPGKTNLGGSGVGLALSLELARLHGGRLGAKSEEGKGSTFTLSLPGNVIVKNKPVSNPPIDSVAWDSEEENLNVPSYDGQRPTILMVEDNPDMRKYINGHLRDDYNIIEAVDGQDALDKLDKINPDLIISDVMMPRIDGLELARQLKESEKYKFIPFITLTARAEERDKLEALRLGIDDYILKPFNPEELQVRAGNLISNYKERQAIALVEDHEEVAPTHEEKLIKSLEEKVKESIQNSQFSVKDLAEYAIMSESTLHRSLKKATGLSPGQFIREIRLQTAITLLEGKQYATIAEVVQAVGFENNAHFSSLFKKRFGKSPSALV